MFKKNKRPGHIHKNLMRMMNPKIEKHRRSVCYNVTHHLEVLL